MVTRSVRELIKQSLSSIPYEKVILFGSQARGEATSQSDFDLLVILKEATPIGRKIHLSTMLRKSFASRMVDVDVLVKDASDVDYLKDKPGSVVRQALQEGVSL
ncbi:MAG TPA: nucleotidyltransferase domain-containing protein [Sedimentisphaerales bacterium]|nr:nucleotidyltransferase domain-containing protein [Sedimentisphaerales bacterium]